MTDWQKWMPVAGLVMTLLQTVVAVIALFIARSNSSQPSASQRKEVYRLILKAFLFLLYSTIPASILAALAMDGVKPNTPFDKQPILFTLPFSLQATFTWAVLLFAFFRSGRSVGIAVAYGIFTSVLITATSSLQFVDQLKQPFVAAANGVLAIHATIATVAIFVVFSTLAIRTLDGALRGDDAVHNVTDEEETSTKAPSSRGISNPS